MKIEDSLPKSQRRMTFHFLQVLVMVGTINSFILFISAFYVSRRYRQAALFLGLFILSVTLGTASYSILPKIQRTYDWMCLIRIPSVYLVGPFALFFAKAVNEVDFRLKKKDWLHFIPNALEIVLALGFWVYIYYFDYANRMAHLKNQIIWAFYEGIAIIIIPIYLYYAHQAFKKNQAHHEVKSFYRLVFYGILIMYFGWLTYFIVEVSMYPESLNGRYHYPLWLFRLFFLMYIGFSVLFNPKKIFPANPLPTSKDQKATSL